MRGLRSTFSSQVSRWNQLVDYSFQQGFDIQLSYRISNGNSKKKNEMLDRLPSIGCGAQFLAQSIEDKIVRLWVVDLVSCTLIMLVANYDAIQ